MDLFTLSAKSRAPLADRMRPTTLEEFAGQEQLIGPGRLLRRAIEADRLTSSIFYGPPGTGKTTLAAIIAQHTQSAFEKLNAVTSGVKEVREIIAQAEDRLKLHGRSTYLLLDECHRWNKAQSDAILPAVEQGTIRFIGATTENPMISMTPALVSRCRLFQFQHLSAQDIEKLLQRAVADKDRGLGNLNVQVDPAAYEHLARMAGGDVRSALNGLELAALSTPPDGEGCIHVTLAVAEESIQQRVLPMDESLLYDMLSAFCKSLRGGDSDAAIAWCMRMLHAGMDPRIICRRLIAHASEDVGLANPNALVQAVSAAHALEFIGLPEAKLNLTQAIIYICESPKSNAVVAAMGAAEADLTHYTDEPVPAHLRDTSYRGADKLGAGKGYQYPHDYPGHWVAQAYMPPSVAGHIYYRPGELGYEGNLRQQWLRKHPDQQDES